MALASRDGEALVRVVTLHCMRVGYVDDLLAISTLHSSGSDYTIAVNAAGILYRARESIGPSAGRAQMEALTAALGEVDVADLASSHDLL